jgi:glycosyltransferase involved in cell wall biosynthesis
MDKVSVIIPTYNRFTYLLNAIKSVQDQTYKNVEIIIVNDGSTEDEYYNHDFGNNIKVIHLKKNTKDKFGFPCQGYVRTVGMKKATGKYIAFLDDDDIWLPNKLELQIDAMKITGCKMSCTDGLMGTGPYNSDKEYKKYNAEHFYATLQNIYRMKGSNVLENGFPEIWNLDFLKIHNCMICSSVVLDKDILKKINYMKVMRSPGEDYDCWLRALKYTDCVYVKDICFYYDNSHGDGQNY